MWATHNLRYFLYSHISLNIYPQLYSIKWCRIFYCTTLHQHDAHEGKMWKTPVWFSNTWIYRKCYSSCSPSRVYPSLLEIWILNMNFSNFLWCFMEQGELRIVSSTREMNEILNYDCHRSTCFTQKKIEWGCKISLFFNFISVMQWIKVG